MADGAVQVDGTYLTLAEVIDAIVGIVREAAAAAPLAGPQAGSDPRGRGLPLADAATDRHDRCSHGGWPSADADRRRSRGG